MEDETKRKIRVLKGLEVGAYLAQKEKEIKEAKVAAQAAAPAQAQPVPMSPEMLKVLGDMRSP